MENGKFEFNENSEILKFLDFFRISLLLGQILDLVGNPNQICWFSMKISKLQTTRSSRLFKLRRSSWVFWKAEVLKFLFLARLVFRFIFPCCRGAKRTLVQKCSWSHNVFSHRELVHDQNVRMCTSAELQWFLHDWTCVLQNLGVVPPLWRDVGSS